MQQQTRRAICAPLVPAKPERQTNSQDQRSGPTELDLDQLEHVAGGDAAATPKKYW